MPEQVETPTAAETKPEAETKPKTESKRTKTSAAPQQQAAQETTPEIAVEIRSKIAAEAIEQFKKEQEASDAEAKRIAKEEADKEKGKFKDLYEGEQKKLIEAQARAATLELELKRSRIESRLRDHVQAAAPEYASAIRYMSPLLSIDQNTKDDAADQQIKEIVEQYVKDNPRSRGSGTLPPPAKADKATSNRFSNGNPGSIYQSSRLTNC